MRTLNWRYKPIQINFLILQLLAPTKELRQVYYKAKKLPVHWSSKVPFKYKRSAVTGELHRAKRKALEFDEETKIIRNKYTDVGYPKHIIENTIRNFNRKKDGPLIPP